jgi:lysozyme
MTMLSVEDRAQLVQYLLVSEGLRLKPYTDTVGKLSIGIGRNLTDVGISALEAYDLCNHDIDRACDALVKRYPWVVEQDVVRQVVLVELMFNMGPKGLGSFVNTLRAFKRKDYPAAAEGLRQSKWYRQVQASRSSRIIQMVLTGDWA